MQYWFVQAQSGRRHTAETNIETHPSRKRHLYARVASRPQFHLFPYSVSISSRIECVLPPLRLLRLGQIYPVNSVNADDNDTEITSCNRVMKIRDFLTELEICVIWLVANRSSRWWISERSCSDLVSSYHLRGGQLLSTSRTSHNGTMVCKIGGNLLLPRPVLLALRFLFLP